jgi:hypothetical protein
VKTAHKYTQGGEGIRGDETGPPRQIFEKLVNKNAIKPKMVYPLEILLKKP